jgi:hypothetical protein
MTNIQNNVNHITIDAPIYTCPSCNNPQGADFIYNQPGFTLTLTLTDGTKTKFTLCDNCHDKKLKKPWTDRKLKTVLNRVNKNPSKFVKVIDNQS